MKRNKGVDIIVPVYNALDDLKLCVESIKKHTDLNLDRLVLIDDKSPDTTVYPYMKSLEQPGIVVLQNEQNEGFSGTINKGMQFSDRDVLLLNSDTVVTAGWMDKIVACAYSDRAIGTVTPFSNNATLCSIPNFCQENTIPYGLSIDEYAGVIERCSLKQYPRISVAVGFCMFIKREVIDRVGLFDKETFQRGYGEENDFCWRAEQFGYRHVLCDDTYIYHSGTASFLSEEKKQLIAEHERILQERYPKQNQANAEYVRDNPHQYLRNNVDLYAKLKNGKKNVLYVLHLDFRSDTGNSVGGTQFHVKDLMMNLRPDHNVFVFARDGEVLRLTIYLAQEQVSLKFRIGKADIFQSFYSEEIRKVYKEILSAFSIDLVHVHHMTGLSFDVFDTAKEMGIPVLLTAHDFYYICPTIKLMENGTAYCATVGKDCVACLHKQLGYANQVYYLDTWRETCRRVLGECDVLIAPSDAVKEIYTKAYPEIGERFCVIPHGMDSFEEKTAEIRQGASSGFSCSIEHAFERDYSISGWALQEGLDSSEGELFVCVEDMNGKRGSYPALSVNRPDVAAREGDNRYLCSGFSVQIPDCWFASGPLKVQLSMVSNGERFYSAVETVSGYKKREKTNRRIAFLGGLNEFKGSQIACQMIKQGGSRYDWYIIGGIGDPELITLEKGNVHKLGWYKRESVGAILRQNQIDLVCILSTWPETFCYTLSEVEIAGIPVLATDIGALGDRLRQDRTGWLVEPNQSGKDVLQKLDEIFADEEDFIQTCERAENFRHRTIGEMCLDYAHLYKKFPSLPERTEEFDAQGIYHAYVMGQSEPGAYGSVSDIDLIRRVTELENTLQAIDQSLEYRMVKFFNRENFPFKRVFKWMVRVAYKAYKLIRR